MTQAHDPSAAIPAPASGIFATGTSDPLTDVLRNVRMTAASFFLIDATQPYCVDIPHTDHYRDILQPGARHMMSYHVITEGTGVALVPGGQPVTYEAGDIIVFPQGDGYRMGTATDTPPEFDYDQTIAFFQGLADGSLPFTVTEGGGRPPPTRVICGFLGCEAGPFNPLLLHLPPLLRIRRANRSGMLDRLINLTIAEQDTSGPGQASLRLGLAELLFVEAIRHHVATAPEGRGWLAGLRDPVLARALAALHGDPAADWTLDRLARAASASRSVLTERFTTTLGRAPMQYLTGWRIQLAAQRLSETGDTIGAVADAVGYRSDSAFSRAFKKVAGISPARWRQGAARDTATT